MPVTSCPDAIAKAIERVVKASQSGSALPPCPSPLSAVVPGEPIIPRPGMTPAEAKLAKYCPECGSPMEHEGGCVTCRNCGYSKCG